MTCDLIQPLDMSAWAETKVVRAGELRYGEASGWIIVGQFKQTVVEFDGGKADRSHITVTFADDTPLTNIERLALQAMLGSDRLHELLSYRGHFRGDPEPTCFFEKPSEPA